MFSKRQKNFKVDMYPKFGFNYNKISDILIINNLLENFQMKNCWYYDKLHEDIV